jgi:hypothetical protein
MSLPEEVTLQSHYVNKDGVLVNDLVASHLYKDCEWTSFVKLCVSYPDFSLWYVENYVAGKHRLLLPNFGRQYGSVRDQ